MTGNDYASGITRGARDGLLCNVRQGLLDRRTSFTHMGVRARMTSNGRYRYGRCYAYGLTFATRVSDATCAGRSTYRGSQGRQVFRDALQLFIGFCWILRKFPFGHRVTLAS